MDEETHRHQCLQCGTIWMHGNNCKGDLISHLCPGCGVEEREWYEGPELPTHIGDCAGPDHRSFPMTIETFAMFA